MFTVCRDQFIAFTKDKVILQPDVKDSNKDIDVDEIACQRALDFMIQGETIGLRIGNKIVTTMRLIGQTYKEEHFTP